MRNYYAVVSLFIVLNAIYVKANEDNSSLKKSPIIIDADTYHYDGAENNITVTAVGDVEAVQDNQKVLADKLEYNYSNDKLTATGHTVYYDKEGNVLNADKVILYNQMQYGEADNLTINLNNDSTVRGTHAYKENDKWLNINDGFYTSCKICEGKAPIWNIKAKEAALDEEEQKMTYNHALFEFYGKPIFYTPYLSHYTRKAKRKTGFLSPIYGGSSYLGKAVKLPFYLNLAPNYDATITPVYTSSRGPVLEGEYRHLLKNGQMKTRGSITSAKDYTPPNGQSQNNHDIRYNLESEGKFGIFNRKNIGWQIANTSDKTYRKDYNYGNEDFLTSRLYTNSYQTDSSYEIQTLSFQNLRPETSSNQNHMNQTPIVLPYIESENLLHRFNDNSKWTISSSMYKINRYNGPDTNRLSIKNMWNKSHLTDNGQSIDLYSSFRNDLYYYDNAPVNNKDYTGYTSRNIPEAGAKWTMPFGRDFGDNQYMISPIATAVATPYSNYNRDIYNEDSGDTNEINDINLFSTSQFKGLDLIENTPRVGYGVENSLYNKSGSNISFLLGQMYQQKAQVYFSDSGNNHFSDFIGRLKFDYPDKFNLSYQFTIDKSNYENKTNELSSTYIYKKLFIRSDLLYYRNGQIVNGVKNRRELFLETGIKGYKDLSFSVNARKNLSPKKDNPDLYTSANGWISYGAKTSYLNDCIEYSFNINRDLTSNDGKSYNTSYWFQINLKT